MGCTPKFINSNNQHNRFSNPGTESLYMFKIGRVAAISEAKESQTEYSLYIVRKWLKLGCFLYSYWHHKLDPSHTIAQL